MTRPRRHLIVDVLGEDKTGISSNNTRQSHKTEDLIVRHQDETEASLILDEEKIWFNGEDLMPQTRQMRICGNKEETTPEDPNMRQGHPGGRTAGQMVTRRLDLRDQACCSLNRFRFLLGSWDVSPTIYKRLSFTRRPQEAAADSQADIQWSGRGGWK